MLQLVGLFERSDYAARQRYQRMFVVALAIIPCIIYFWTGEPVGMIKAGGMILGLMLPVLAWSVVYLRHTHLPGEVRPGGLATVLLWFAAALSLVAMVGFVGIQAGLIRG